jgi:DNA-binding CsgD family transcriptional regulator
LTPQATLGEFSRTAELSPLTDAEQDAWTAVEQGDRGVREYARETGRSPGTVGNLLARARRKLGVSA